MISIPDLRALPAGESHEGELRAQVQGLARKQTKEGKPFLEVSLADAGGQMTLRAWSDHPQFDFLADLTPNAFVGVEGQFLRNPTFGPDARNWRARTLAENEIETLLAGSDTSRADAEFTEIGEMIRTLSDPRLREICLLFLETHGDRFRRTAAARNYHHARRGGLVEHAAAMMRCAQAVSTVYPELNRDLLIAGALLHDCGKLWENAFAERGFTMPHRETGELLGHIITGIEVVNTLWRDLAESPAAANWGELTPASEDVRLHLLHLIGAHHGELEFGSPVTPRTPEAVALHHIDNLDAKLWMFRAAYPVAIPLAPRIFERVRPLPGNLVLPLQPFVPADDAPESAEPE